MSKMLILFPTTDGEVQVDLANAIGFINVDGFLCVHFTGERKLQTNAGWEEFVQAVYNMNTPPYRIVRESDLLSS